MSSSDNREWGKNKASNQIFRGIVKNISTMINIISRDKTKYDTFHRRAKVFVNNKSHIVSNYKSFGSRVPFLTFECNHFHINRIIFHVWALCSKNTYILVRKDLACVDLDEGEPLWLSDYVVWHVLPKYFVWTSLPTNIEWPWTSP